MSGAQAPGLDGSVTPGTPSRTLGEVIPMADIRPAHADPGTMLQVAVRESLVPDEVVQLPSRRRQRRGPPSAPPVPSSEAPGAVCDGT